MLIRSKAPLRLGLGGGGSDVSPYSDIYGGAILNATISMYAYATIEPTTDGMIVFNAIDKGEHFVCKSVKELKPNGTLDLIKGIYNRVVRDFTHKPLSFILSTYVDAPPGSGLGSSSTLVTTILGAFSEWLNIPLGEYDLAHLAFEIERIDMGLSGGKQDQYAATFGGVNFMEFYADDKVIVNPLRIKEKVLDELAFKLILYYTESSRSSSMIIEKQQKNVIAKKTGSIEAMHRIKDQAIRMKEVLLLGELDNIGKILDYSWQYKKQMAEGITTPLLEDMYSTAIGAGATGGKISGAGGGGFMFFYCPGNNRYEVVNALDKKFNGAVKRYEFNTHGLKSWTV